MDADPDLQMVMRRVARARGFSCEVYKESCLRRRINVRMRARGAHTLAAYAEILDRDGAEFDRLLQALTVNVTKFYRNPDTWHALAEDVVPELVKRRYGAVRCWSAGCATGEEPYTLAMLLLEEARRKGVDSMDPRIDATDVDERCLAEAVAGRYRARSLDEAPAPLLARYLRDANGTEPREVVPEVKAIVRFRSHNLTQEPPPRPPYDLVLCRNVVIYFDRPTQEALSQTIADALVPGGYLVLGKVETLFGDAVPRLRLVNVRERIYQKQ